MDQAAGIKDKQIVMDLTVEKDILTRLSTKKERGIIMRKTFLSGLAIGFLVLGMPWNACAATIVLHVPTGQLGGINEVEFADGSLWDATFNNNWTLSGQELYGFDFAQTASAALSNAFSTTPDLEFYSGNLQYIWGIENISVANLLTPTLSIPTGIDAYVIGGFYYNSMAGVQSIRSLGIQAWPNDQWPIYSFVQWTESAISNDDGDDDNNAPVPEPATMILFGLGLLGLAGVSRKK